jgi:hypothetical protein
MEFDLIDLFLAFGLGCVVAWRMCEARLAKNFAADPDRIIELLQLIKRLKAEVAAEESLGLDPDRENVEVSVEQLAGPVWYAYRKDTGEFLAQSNTSLDDVMQKASDRYPDLVLWTHKPKQDSQPA